MCIAGSLTRHPGATRKGWDPNVVPHVAVAAVRKSSQSRQSVSSGVSWMQKLRAYKAVQ
jgi:hypothetical protein